MPIANEDVEAVARAIFDQLCTGEHSAMAQIDFARQRRYKEAARAALSAAPIERMREALERSVEAAYEEGVEDGVDWGCNPCGEPKPQWIDSVARVNLLRATLSGAR